MSGQAKYSPLDKTVLNASALGKGPVLIVVELVPLGTGATPALEEALPDEDALHVEELAVGSRSVGGTFTDEVLVGPACNMQCQYGNACASAGRFVAARPDPHPSRPVALAQLPPLVQDIFLLYRSSQMYWQNSPAYPVPHGGGG